MSQLTIKLSDKADALIAQLQKEIFNRRRKKVSAAGVVETLVESGAKSQSDKRFATSWKNLIADIEKSAKVANAHGSKPANLSDAEWAMILSHRTRVTTSQPAAKRTARKAVAKKPAQATAKPVAAKAAAAKTKPAAKARPVAKAAAKNPVKKTAAAGTTVRPAAKTATSSKPAASKAVAKKAVADKKSVAKKPAARQPAAKAGGSSVAKRMAKAVSRLSASAAPTPSVAAPSSNGTGVLASAR